MILLVRVLVVEDDKNTAVFVSKALRSEGYAVDVLHNEFVQLQEIDAAEEVWLRNALQEHVNFTGSPRAARLLSRRGSLGLMRVQPLHFQGTVEQTWAPLLNAIESLDTARPIALSVSPASQAIHA